MPSTHHQLKNAWSAVKPFESKQTKTLWTRKEREVAKRTKAEKQAVLSDEKKAAIPKAKPITDIYASLLNQKMAVSIVK